MGKKPLTPQTSYKFKLATAETSAKITKIIHLVNSDTLASSPAETVGFNEVAEVEIQLHKPLAMDLFSSHKATGRFVLQDGYDVAGGGIIIWAEDRVPIKDGFVHGNIKARCEVFEEYFYHLGDQMVTKVKTPKPLYTVGDRVPLKGLSYQYPQFFDIIIFRDLAAVQIREGKVAGLVNLAEYTYEGLPLVNGRGFGVLVNSPEDWAKIKADFQNITPEKESALAQRWFDFNTYRSIPMGWEEYSI
jgi:hypothetical protein